MERKDFTPLILSLLLLAGIALFSFFRYERGLSVWANSAFDLDIVFSILYLLWMLLESPIARKDASTEGKQTMDRGTCQIYALGQAMTFLSALWVPSIWKGPGTAHLLGIVVFLAGVSFRLWAIRTLGQFYSHKVRKMAKHHIVDTGPYHFIRHPAYAGMLLANIGICIYFLNGLTTGLFFFVLAPAIVIRIFIEERMLFGIEGYSEFARSRRRLAPFIW